MGNSSVCYGMLRRRERRASEINVSNVHLLRLWAQVYNIEEQAADDDASGSPVSRLPRSWTRRSEHVAPINVICCHDDSVETIFQVLAYNRHVEKILDVTIRQPGTMLKHGAECFVYWKDQTTQQYWGLNFLNSTDAHRFTDCCMGRIRLLRRNSSTSSSIRIQTTKARGTLSDDGLTSLRHDLTMTTGTVVMSLSRDSTHTSAEHYDVTIVSRKTSIGSTYDNVGTITRSCDVISRDVMNRWSRRSFGIDDVSRRTTRGITETSEMSSIIQVNSELVLNCSTLRPTGDDIASCNSDISRLNDDATQSNFRQLDMEILDDGQTLQRQGTRLSDQVDCRTIEQDNLGIELESDDVTATNQRNSKVDSRRDVVIRINDIEEIEDSKCTEGIEDICNRNDTRDINDIEDIKAINDINDINCIEKNNRSTSSSQFIPNSSGDHSIDVCEEVKSSKKNIVTSIDDIAVPADESIRVPADGSESTNGLKFSDLKSYSILSSDSESTYTSDVTDMDVCDVISDNDDDGVDDESLDAPSALRRTRTRTMAGWLTVKNWLTRKKDKVVLVSRRRWKTFWVVLETNRLMLYDQPPSAAAAATATTSAYSDVIRDAESVTGVKPIFVVRAALAQPIPEHPKKDHVFVVNTPVGDVFLCQAASSSQVDRWVSAVHSACALSLVRSLNYDQQQEYGGRDGIIRLLKAEIGVREDCIDQDNKMKNMADLQLAGVINQRNRQAIQRQIAQWNTQLERFHLELYQLRCYLSAVHGAELPNPKTMLSNISRASKMELGRTSLSTNVSTFHALVSARSAAPTLSSTRHVNRPLSAELKTASTSVTNASLIVPSYQTSPLCNNMVFTDDGSVSAASISSSSSSNNASKRLVKVLLPNEQTPLLISMPEHSTVSDLLRTVCSKQRLCVDDYFIQLNGGTEKHVHVATGTQLDACRTLLSNLNTNRIELCAKTLYRVKLVKENGQGFGMLIEAELSENDEEQRIFVSDVATDSIADRSSVATGDEIMLIDGSIVCQLDITDVLKILRDSSAICLTLRTCRPLPNSPGGATYITSLICPPPPTSQQWLDDSRLRQLVVPGPLRDARCGANACTIKQCDLDSANMNANQSSVDSLLQTADQVTKICQQSNTCRPEADGESGVTHQHHVESNQELSLVGKPLTPVQHIRKVIREIVSTERQYVKDLCCLMDRYLKPLKDETFFSASDDTEQLLVTICGIIQFQKSFLDSLEGCSGESGSIDSIQVSLQSIGELFQHCSNQFRVYSAFCTCYSRTHKLLSSGNPELEEFLRVRNPKSQHSVSLESYLIKPIQRVLKYPLLLQQLIQLTSSIGLDYQHLTVALKSMQSVAEYVNEMQKINEDFGDIFEELINDMKYCLEGLSNGNTLPRLSDLVHYGTVSWLNAHKSLVNGLRKGNRLQSTLFVFMSCIVLIVVETTNKNRKRTKSWLLPLSQSPSGVTSSNPNLAQPVVTDTTRFTCVMPVTEVTVRTSLDDDYTPATSATTSGVLELVHFRSEKKGRPETVYALSVSTDENRRCLVSAINHVTSQRDGDWSSGRTSRLNFSLLRSCGDVAKQPSSQSRSMTLYSGSSTLCSSASNIPVTAAEIDRRTSHKLHRGAASDVLNRRHSVTSTSTINSDHGNNHNANNNRAARRRHQRRNSSASLRASDREKVVDSSSTNTITDSKKNIDIVDNIGKSQQSSEFNLLSLSLSPL